MRKEDRSKLRANQYFLVEELERRGISVTAVDVENELLEASLGSHRELLLNIDSSLVSYAASVTASEKPVARALLMRAGLSATRGATFTADEKHAALAFAETIGYPVVAKPPYGVQGEDVYTHIEYPNELEAVFDSYYRRNGSARLMVEEHFFGKEHRIFITRNGDYAVLLRDPAYVTGDGLSTIRELSDAENYKRTSPRTNCLCPLLLDSNAEAFLGKQGMTFDSVPRKDQKVYVRGNSNVKTGGMCEDVTDSVHPSVLGLAGLALHAFPGLPYAGVDFMCEDISKPQTEDSYRIIEVNSLPGIGMHINPGRGKSRNVAGMIVDMMYPETVRMRLAA